MTELSIFARPADAGVPGVTYVGFGRRFAARFLDTVLHYALGFIAGMVLVILAILAQAVLHTSAAAVMAKMRHTTSLSFLFAMFGSFAYEVICLVGFGSTAGKLMLGMVVLDEDLKPCSLKAAVIRELGFFIDAIFFGVVAYSSMRTSPERQRYGDRWAHTVVVTRDSAPPASLRSAGRFVVVFLLALAVDGIAIMLGTLL
jgi:uncharacterized RDD family membrane protein YckC